MQGSASRFLCIRSETEMVTITLKGREIPLLFTTLEMKTVQEEVAPFGKFLRLLFGRAEGDKDAEASLFSRPEHLNAVAKAIRILGNAGLEEAGEEPDLTDKKALRALRPPELVDVMNACMEAINEGMASEIPEEPSNEPVDVTLEEMKKKKERAG